MPSSNPDSLRNRIDFLLLVLERLATSSIVLGFVAYSIGFLVKFVILFRTLEGGQNISYFMMIIPYKEILMAGILFTSLPVILLSSVTIVFHAVDKITDFSYSSEEESEKSSRRKTFITMIPIILVIAFLGNTSAASAFTSSILLFILITYMLWSEKLLKPSSGSLLQRIDWQAAAITYLLLLSYSLINAGAYSRPGATFSDIKIERSSSNSSLRGYLVGSDQSFLIVINYQGRPQGVPIKDISGIKYIARKGKSGSTTPTYGTRLYRWIVSLI